MEVNKVDIINIFKSEFTIIPIELLIVISSESNLDYDILYKNLILFGCENPKKERSCKKIIKKLEDYFYN